MSNNSGEITFEEGLLIASSLQVKKSKVSSLHLLEPLLIDAEASGRAFKILCQVNLNLQHAV